MTFVWLTGLSQGEQHPCWPGRELYNFGFLFSTLSQEHGMLYSNTSHASIDTSWLALGSWLTRLCMFRMAEELRGRRKSFWVRVRKGLFSQEGARPATEKKKTKNWRTWRRTRYNPTLNSVQYFQDGDGGLRVDISQLHVQYMMPCAMLFTARCYRLVFTYWHYWYSLWFYCWLWFTDCRLFPIDLLWYMQELWAQDEFLCRDNNIYCIVQVI